MAKEDMQALRDMRLTVVDRRRSAARDRNLDNVLKAQQEIALLDQAIADERHDSDSRSAEADLERIAKSGPENAFGLDD